MEQLLETRSAPDTDCSRSISPHRPASWLRGNRLTPQFWAFFGAAFFFDFGFSVYFFLFNLYLLDLRFGERAIGLVSGAFTLGSVAVMLPAGVVARRIGVRPVLVVCFVAAPILGAMRTMVHGESAQIGLALAAGMAMGLWGVCFLPAVARLTTVENRAYGFSVIFSASVGTSALGGIVCGYLPLWLNRAGFTMQPQEVKRLILQASCGIASLGLLAVLRVTLPPRVSPGEASKRPWHELLKRNSFLLRFLPSMALWTAVLAGFTPFANVYLAHELHIPFSKIGLVFSLAQILQLCVGLFTPLLFRALGLIRGIAATQLMAGLALGLLALTRSQTLAMSLYLGFSALQWMSSPGLYNLLMSEVAEDDRSAAASLTLFCNALLQAAAMAGAGILFARFGYTPVLIGIASVAILTALIFRTLVGRSRAAAAPRVHN